MIRTQSWTPDTCTQGRFVTACAIEESYDDSLPARLRVMSLVRFNRTCLHHAPIQDPTLRYAAVKQENQRKNVAIGKICEEVGEIGLECQWEIEPTTRALSITEPAGLTVLQRTRLAAAFALIGADVSLRSRS